MADFRMILAGFLFFCLALRAMAMTPEELKQAHDLCMSHATGAPGGALPGGGNALQYTLPGCDEIGALWEIRRKQDQERDQGVLNELMKH